MMRWWRRSERSLRLAGFGGLRRGRKQPAGAQDVARRGPAGLGRRWWRRRLMLTVIGGIKKCAHLIPAMFEMKNLTVQAEIALKLFGNHTF